MAIAQCSCKNEFQDARYGNRMRVMNETVKGNLRCTVCNAEKRKDSSNDKSN